MNQYSMPATTATTPAHHKFPAAWVSGAFCPLDRDFLTIAVPHLSARAIRVYMAHLAIANQTSAKSFAHRDALAAHLRCSVDTVDRGNDELAEKGLIVHDGRRYRCGGPVVWVLQPPSKWHFAAGKSAEPVPPISPEGAAHLRPYTKSIEKEVPNKNMDAMPENSFPDAGEALDSDAIEALALELIRRDVRPDQARRWARSHPQQSRAALDYVRHRPSCGGGFIVTAIQNPEVMNKPTATANGAAYSEWQGHREAPQQPPTDEQRAAREQVESQAVQLCLSKLTESRRAYIEACQKTESLSLGEILERDCNWEMSIARREVGRGRAH